MKLLGLLSSIFAAAVMSWLYFDWLTINGMNEFAAICFVGALTLFATALFEIAIAFRINAGHLKLRIPTVKKDQQDLIVELVKKRRSFANWCFAGCALLELINAFGVFGAQMVLIQDANKSHKVVATVVVTTNSQTLQDRIDAIEKPLKEAESKIDEDERRLRTQLRSLYEDDKTRLQSPEWQGWLHERERRRAVIEKKREAEEPLQDALDKLTLQSVESSQSENRETGVIKGTLFQFIAGLFGWDVGVVQFVIMSIPSLLLGMIAYGGLAIFLYYKPTREEKK